MPYFSMNSAPKKVASSIVPGIAPGPGGRMARALPALAPAEIAGDAVISRLREAGHAALRVGGCVRDRLLGRAVADVDVATSALPSEVQELFPRTYAVGAAFGVVIVHADHGVDVEVATFREERGYADGRHPDEIRFASPAEDAQRRDFSVNALFYDPCEGAILDFTGGMADLRRGVIRAIGEPAARFREDGLRLLRAVRFAAELGFELDPATAAAVMEMAAGLERISAERVSTELTRMLTGRAPAAALRRLSELRLLQHWLPEVEAMSGVCQPAQFHPEGDVWQHTLVMLELLRGASATLAWAVLLHDVGKPPTFEFSDGRERFPRHAKVGGEMVRTILARLRASRQLTDDVAEIVANHMSFADVGRMRPATLRRLMARPTFADELELHRLDCLASHGKLDNYVLLLDAIAARAAEPAIPPPLITGRDVLALGISPGPRVGELLREAQERQLNGELRSPQEALEWAKIWLKNAGGITG